MTATLVHSQRFVGSSPLAILPSVAPTPGNLMVLCVTTHNHGLGPSVIPGWTTIPPGVLTATTSFTRDYAMFYRRVQTGDTSWSPTASGSVFMYSEWSGAGDFLGSVGQGEYGPTFAFVGGGAITTSLPALIVAGIHGTTSGSAANAWFVATTAPAVELDDRAGGGGTPFWSAYRLEAAAGTFTVAGTASNTDGVPPVVAGITAAWATEAPPVAEFTVDLPTGLVGFTAAFTDLSTNTPTSWAWDFGDGATSTSQHPSHVYAAAGTYTVSLTATNADGSDTETKTSYITVFVDVGYEPPTPAKAILEIYAAAPGSARWDVALWDEAVWSEAGWQDVTPEGIAVEITWGSSRPELGILSQPDAATWAVDLYDPQRFLDPANAEGPFYTDLQPGLPIRLSHRSTVIRQGIVESIGHAYADTTRNGYIRATDNISRMANAEVPSDTTLSDTLYARTVDAIAAAGLSVTVLAPIGTDPALSPWVTGTREWSVWEWILDAAQEVLHIPIVDRLGAVSFRPWASPLTRGRSVNSPELVDLAVINDYSGRYSVIRAREDVDTVIERRLTPLPRYGARSFVRDEYTLDPGGWAEAVLTDRGLPGLRWVPGRTYPLTANSTEALATIEAVELVSLAVPEQEPPVSATAIVVGGRVTVRGKSNAEAFWSFEYQAAQTAIEPLIETGGDPTDYLLATGGDQFLYPST